MTSKVDFEILALESAIEVLQEQIKSLRGGVQVTRTTPKTDQPELKRRGRKPGSTISPEARQRIREAQQKRWAAEKAAKQRHVEAEIPSAAPEEAVSAQALASAAAAQSPLPQESGESRVDVPLAPRRGRPPGKGGKRGD